jgi:hypothetical protein
MPSTQNKSDKELNTLLNDKTFVHRETLSMSNWIKCRTNMATLQFQKSLWRSMCGTTLWGQVLMFICRFVVYVSWHNTIFTGSVSIQKGNVISGCFMGEFYSGMNFVDMFKETFEVFFRLGPLHVNVVYETKPGNWDVGCRLHD